MGLEEVQQLGEAAGREAVVAADALMEFASISFATLSDFSRLTGPPRRCPPISRKTWFNAECG